MQRFKNVLLVIDEKSESRAALPQAVALCHRNGATLTPDSEQGDQKDCPQKDHPPQKDLLINGSLGQKVPEGVTHSGKDSQGESQ